MTGKIRKRHWLILIVALIISISFISCVPARPPKPGPNFVWEKAHTNADGDLIPGHWKHVGPAVPEKGKVWVPAHYGPRGRWVPGHWR